jgi:hypothetical protein
MRAASIIRAIMEAARTPETSVDIRLRTRQYIPEDSDLHTRCRENLQSHICLIQSFIWTSLIMQSAVSVLYAENKSQRKTVVAPVVQDENIINT